MSDFKSWYACAPVPQNSFLNICSYTNRIHEIIYVAKNSDTCTNGASAGSFQNPVYSLTNAIGIASKFSNQSFVVQYLDSFTDQVGSINVPSNVSGILGYSGANPPTINGILITDGIYLENLIIEGSVNTTFSTSDASITLENVVIDGNNDPALIVVGASGKALLSSSTLTSKNTIAVLLNKIEEIIIAKSKVVSTSSKSSTNLQGFGQGAISLNGVNITQFDATVAASQGGAAVVAKPSKGKTAGDVTPSKGGSAVDDTLPDAGAMAERDKTQPPPEAINMTGSTISGQTNAGSSSISVTDSTLTNPSGTAFIATDSPKVSFTNSSISGKRCLCIKNNVDSAISFIKCELKYIECQNLSQKPGGLIQMCYQSEPQPSCITPSGQIGGCAGTQGGCCPCNCTISADSPACPSTWIACIQAFENAIVSFAIDSTTANSKKSESSFNQVQTIEDIKKACFGQINLQSNDNSTIESKISNHYSKTNDPNELNHLIVANDSSRINHSSLSLNLINANTNAAVPGVLYATEPDASLLTSNTNDVVETHSSAASIMHVAAGNHQADMSGCSVENDGKGKAMSCQCDPEGGSLSVRSSNSTHKSKGGNGITIDGSVDFSSFGDDIIALDKAIEMMQSDGASFSATGSSMTSTSPTSNSSLISADGTSAIQIINGRLKSNNPASPATPINAVMSDLALLQTNFETPSAGPNLATAQNATLGNSIASLTTPTNVSVSGTKASYVPVS